MGYMEKIMLNQQGPILRSVYNLFKEHGLSGLIVAQGAMNLMGEAHCGVAHGRLVCQVQT